MAEIVTLPGVKGQFALGLSWRHEDTVPGRRALRALASVKGRWAVIRRTSAGTVQAGFCEAPAGVQAGRHIRALASVVADLRPQPWMGVYRLAENRYWYIAVRDAQEVIPDGDQVGTFEEIARVQERHLSYGEWSRIEGSVDDLVEMAMTVPVAPALRDMRSGRGIRAATAAACVLVATIALSAWQRHEHTLTLRQQAWLARQHALAAGASVHDAAPWTHEPMPSAVFGNCDKAWREQPLASAGWTLSRWGCEVQPRRLLLTTAWTRSGGLASAAPGVLAPDAQHASASAAMDVASGSSSAAVLPEERARRAVWTLAQTYGMKLVVQTAQAVTTLPGATSASRASVEPWSATDFHLTLDAPPWPGLGPAFDAIPGLRINAVTFDLATLQWTVSATAYGQRDGGQSAAVGLHASAGAADAVAGRGQP